MSLQYKLVPVQQVSQDTVARVIRDDVNGAIVEVVSSGVAARVTVKDLVAEINRLIELEKRAQERPASELEDGVNE